MVLKLTGSLLVTCSCGALGLWKAGQWREHLTMMEQLKKMIILLKGEILYAHAPLQEAFGHVGRKSEGILGQLFAGVEERIEQRRGDPFYVIWREEIEGRKKDLLLTDRERGELTAFGEHLGYLDLEMQEHTVALYLEQLEMSIQFYREHEREQTRLYTSLGIMGGLFLSLMMC
ncbi:MAG: sporulation protein [Hungatella sp.]|nr:sporulation protein [Hungatella sp.]